MRFVEIENDVVAGDPAARSNREAARHSRQDAEARDRRGRVAADAQQRAIAAAGKRGTADAQRFRRARERAALFDRGPTLNRQIVDRGENDLRTEQDMRRIVGHRNVRGRDVTVIPAVVMLRVPPIRRLSAPNVLRPLALR